MSTNNPGQPRSQRAGLGGRIQAASESLATAFLLGTQGRGGAGGGALFAAKHFPGHGDTSSASHLGAGPFLAHDRERLRPWSCPLRQAIAAGCRQCDEPPTCNCQALDPQRPATLSAAVLVKLLRRNLAFAGLVVDRCPGDGGDRRAVGRWRSGRWLALAAGSDLLLMAPPTPMRHRSPARKPCRAGGSPCPGSSRAWSGRERALSSTSLPAPDPGSMRCVFSGGSRGLDERRTGTGQELATLSLQAQGVAQLPAGPGPDLIRLDRQRGPRLSCRLMDRALPSARPLWATRSCLIDWTQPEPLEQRHQRTPGPGAAKTAPGRVAACSCNRRRGNPFRGSAGGEDLALR